nr:MAG TPA: hypothetical protein [Caudoviricetes sp.]
MRKSGGGMPPFCPVRGIRVPGFFRRGTAGREKRVAGGKTAPGVKTA